MIKKGSLVRIVSGANQGVDGVVVEMLYDIVAKVKTQTKPGRSATRIYSIHQLLFLQQVI